MRVQDSSKDVNMPYHIATGLEALFGVLWLSGKHTRLNTLLNIL